MCFFYAQAKTFIMVKKKKKKQLKKKGDGVRYIVTDTLKREDDLIRKRRLFYRLLLF